MIPIYKTPEWTVVNTAELKIMRNSLASYGGALSRARAENIILKQQRKHMDRRLRAMIRKSQSRKDYAEADFIRDRLLSVLDADRYNTLGPP